MSDEALPLRGVVVADFTQVLSGPYCSMLLADLGADVIKVERPEVGDDARRIGPPFVGDTASYFLSVNRNKRSVALDLKSVEGLAQARQLVARADVVIENWLPGTAERVGLGHAELTAADPRLVYCSVSGYGADSAQPGYDQVVQGTSGWMSMSGDAAGGPVKTGVAVGDVATGMAAAHAITAALFRRERTGRGGFIDVAMQDTLVSMLANHAGYYLNTGEGPFRNGNQHLSAAPYGTFEVADGLVNLAVGNDRMWTRLCGQLGSAELADDERYRDGPSRSRHRDSLYAELGAVLAGLTREEVVAAARAAGVPSGPILTVAEALDGPRSKERGMALAAEHPRLGTVGSAGSPWHIDGLTATVERPPPDLGEHTDEVLAWLDESEREEPRR